MLRDDEPLYAALRSRVQELGLGRVAEPILGLARPAIALGLTRTDETAIGVGDSKVGGVADLPPDVEWPSREGGALPFIAQVRLEEVAEFETEGELPHTGLLSFFYAVNDPEGALSRGDPSAWRVLFTEDTARLARRPLPEELAHGLDTVFHACALGFGRRLTLPDPRAAMVEQLGLTINEQRAYMRLVSGDPSGSFEDEMDHRLLGYPYVLDSPPFLAAYMARNGIAWLRSSANNRARLAQLRLKAEEEWRLLLQVYSNEEAEMDWAGGGVIHFGIARKDLAARDFSNVWVSLDFL